MAQRQQGREPPKAPEIERRVRFTRLHAIGLPIIALIPLLAVAGVFGPSSGHRDAQGGALSVEVDYPRRARLRAGASLAITVRNELDRALAGVVVEVEREYVDSFSEVDFTPSVDSADDRVYRIEVGRLSAGASRAVSVQLSPLEYWRLAGAVSAFADGAEELTVPFTTFVFP
jgi:hypothetical protein